MHSIAILPLSFSNSAYTGVTMARMIYSTAFVVTVCVFSACSREKGPKDTIESAVKSMSKNAPQELWNDLPLSYQKDVNDAVRGFGAKVDTELVAAVADFLKFVADTLEKNRAKLIEHPDVRALSSDPAVRADVFDSAITVVRDILNSEISSTDRMKSFDGGKFLKQLADATDRFASAASKITPGDSLTKQRERFGKATVRLLSENESTATVEVTVPDLPTKQLQLVKVEGKWIVKELQDSWGQVKGVLAMLDKQAEEVNKMKAQVLPALTMGRGVVEASIVSGELPPLGLSQFTRHLGRAFSRQSFDPTARLRSDIRNAATSEEAYYVDNEAYMPCNTTAECSKLPGLRLAPEHQISVTTNGSDYQIVGKSDNAPGVELRWNSASGGFTN